MPTKNPNRTTDRTAQREQLIGQMRPIEQEISELAKAEQGLTLQLSDLGRSVELVDTGDGSLLSQIAAERQRTKNQQDAAAVRAEVTSQLTAITSLLRQKRQSITDLQAEADRLQRDIVLDQEEESLKNSFDEYCKAVHQTNLAAVAFNRTAKDCHGAIQRGGGFGGGWPPTARGIEVKHDHINLTTALVSPESLTALAENDTIGKLAQQL
jgi:chromosome segregation ATPase